MPWSEQQEQAKRLSSIGAEKSNLKTLDKYHESKYNNLAVYQFLTVHSRADRHPIRRNALYTVFENKDGFKQIHKEEE